MKEILRALREKNLLSQSAVAEYLNVSRQMYMKYESGENEPSVKMVVLLSRLYKVPYDVIIDNKTDSINQNESKIKTYGYENSVSSSYLSSPSPSYGTSIKVTIFQKKYDSLTDEQKNIVVSLVESLASMNKKILEKGKKQYRTPGGISGKFYMSEDFDETPECFKEYM